MTRNYPLSRLKRRLIITLLSLAIAGGGWLISDLMNGNPSGPAHTLEATQPGLYSINHFVDGDTIAVNMNGHAESVRFIGIDTPETHKPETPVQCYGPQAAAFTKKRIGRGRVRLVSDPLSTDRDRYGRLLRYVYLQDGTLLNAELVKDGYAFYYPYFPFSKADTFKADEQIAMSGDKGLWAACHPKPTDDGGYVSNPQT